MRRRGAGLLAACTAVMMAGWVAGCVAPQGDTAVSATVTAPTTTTVTRTSTTPPIRRDITASITPVRLFVTGASLNGGKVPKATDVLDVTTDGDVTGRLAVAQTAGKSSLSTTATVSTRNAGDRSELALTIRTTSSDPNSTVDILHRPGNSSIDYLLTGNNFRSVAPTPWVTVPQQFGNGIGCVMPGRQTVCEVTADLLANQKLDPQLPSNSATTSSGVTTIHSAITVRQVLALDVWRMQSASAPAVLKRAAKADLDLTLVPVVLQYNNNAGPLLGRPKLMTLSGTFTVAGVEASIDLNWSESVGGQADQVDLPVPTRALYTPLTSKQAKALLAVEQRGY